MYGFAMLSGIRYETLCHWHEGEKVTAPSAQVAKSLKASSEQALVANLITGKSNPVGTIAILNNRFGWDSTGTRDNVKIQIELSNEQIAARLGGRLQSPVIEEKPNS